MPPDYELEVSTLGKVATEQTPVVEGELLTDATLADMTSGVKSLLARLAQPLFRRKGGGTRLPIRISGPRSKPFRRPIARRIGEWRPSPARPSQRSRGEWE